MERKENPHAGHRQRKKEQFRRHGLDAFAPHEALELLLYYAIPRVDTNGMAHALLRRFGSLDGVFRAPVEELMQVEGIGENAALLIRLVPQLYQRSLIELDRPGSLSKITSRRGIFSSNISGESAPRLCWSCAWTEKAGCWAATGLSQGGSSAAAFNVRDAVRYALADNAVSVYLAHNHPAATQCHRSRTMLPLGPCGKVCAPWAWSCWIILWWRTTILFPLHPGGTWMRRSICGSEENDGKNGRNQNQRHARYFGPKAASLIRPTAIRTRKGRQ